MRQAHHQVTSTGSILPVARHHPSTFMEEP